MCSRLCIPVDWDILATTFTCSILLLVTRLELNDSKLNTRLESVQGYEMNWRHRNL